MTLLQRHTKMRDTWLDTGIRELSLGNDLRDCCYKRARFLLENCSSLYRSSSFTQIQSVPLAWYAPFRFWYGISGLVEVVDESVHCSKASGAVINSIHSESIAQRRMVVGESFSWFRPSDVGSYPGAKPLGHDT